MEESWLNIILKNEKAIRKGAEIKGIESYHIDWAFEHLKEDGAVPFKVDIARLCDGMIGAGIRAHYGEMLEELGPDAHRFQEFTKIVKKVL